MAPILTVQGLTLRRDNGEGSAIFENINIEVNEGDILILKGRSGCGKTTLLKCLAELNLYQKGDIRLHGKKASEYGIPNYRTRVLYVPQRPSLLPGTPRHFLTTLQSFRSRQAIKKKSTNSPTTATGGSSTTKDNASVTSFTDSRAFHLAREWGIEPVLWDREWATLSGGEGQRIALAVAAGLEGAEIILLDEPTSALDEETMKKVEKSLVGMVHESAESGGTLKALVWITHEASQAKRVGTREFDVSAHTGGQ